MKNFVKSFVRKIIYLLHHIKQEKFYRHIMAINHIPAKTCDGEKEWLAKWQIGGGRISVTQYRVFSKYIGHSIDIVPEEISHDVIEPLLNPFRYVGYYSDKNVFDKLFPKGVMPKTLIRRMSGVYYDEGYRRLELNDYELKKRMTEFSTPGIIIKPSVDGMSGRGVKLIKGSENLTLQSLENEFGQDFIMQEAMEQSEYISQFNPSSVNTLRMSVYRSVRDDSPHITGAIMRIGGLGSVVDNAHAGGCYVGIHSDGSFCHEVLDQYGQKRTTFNNVDFSNNYCYPNWSEVTEFAKGIAKYVPHHRLLALDIVLDKENKPHLIEFNVKYFSTWLFQYTTGPAFGDYTDEIIDYCRQNVNHLEYQLVF